MRDYEILHSKPGASFAEIQQAYRDLVRVWHPDRFSSDPRLQKIADEKLSEINRAYLVLEKKFQGEAQGVDSPSPGPATVRWANLSTLPTFQWRSIPAKSMAGLWFWLILVLVALGVAQICAFFEAPMRALQSISADANRIAVSNGPSVVDAFQGWNGILPQGLDRLVALYQSTPVAHRRDVEVSRVPVPTASAARVVRATVPAPSLVHGVGEIRVHNRTSEAILLGLKGRRIRAAGRSIAVIAEGDVTLGDLGPDLYTVDVRFPDSQRPPMRLGPFVMDRRSD